MFKAYLVVLNEVIALLGKCGCTPILLCLNNNMSEHTTIFLDDENITLDIIPSYFSRRNTVEWDIRTFEEHFITILYGSEHNFPMTLCDKLFPQATTTLNLFRISRINLYLST